MSAKSNSLFHFTDEMDVLISILEKGFVPMYCKEEIDDLYGDEEYLISTGLENHLGLNTFPMTCFCDIPLTRIKDHMDRYGNFAIGMSQNWGLKKGLTPVFYYSPEMPIYSKMQNLVKTSDTKKYETLFSDFENEDVLHAYDLSLEFVKSIKNYMKPLKIMNDDPKTMKKHKFKYFHIENEWRYVPDQKEFEKATSQKFYINEASRKQHNKKQINLHKQISLKIDIEDIEYIIVKDKQDIDVLIDRIRKWDRKYNERSVDKLLTKIISMRHINDDF